jgi:signal peptidase complex subunit 1
MDFHGQNLSEDMFFWIITIMGALAWLYGYYYQDFVYTFYGWLASVLISIVLCVPDWPYFNRHPVEWLSDIKLREENSGGGGNAGGKSVGNIDNGSRNNSKGSSKKQR